jgi:hypothetical protein
MWASAAVCGAAPDWAREYAATQGRLAQGWNTWNTNTVQCQVLLPEALAITVGFHCPKLFGGTQYLASGQPGGTDREKGQMAMGLHAIDGSYSEMTLTWRGLRARIQSATTGPDLLLLVTPLDPPDEPSTVDFEVGILWDKPGSVSLRDGLITARFPSREVAVFGDGTPAVDRTIPTASPYLSFSLAGNAAVSTGRRRTLGEIERAIAGARARCEEACRRPGVALQTVEAVESALGWDTIYDPAHGRVVSTVSRSWNVGWGGYVLFEWDTFFAGYMAGFFGRDLAYANVIEMLSEATPAGLVPNYASGRGQTSLDRSEPPVGAVVVRDLFRRFGDRWLLEAAFPRLLAWNRWWNERRQVDGYLVLGTDPANPAYDREDGAVNTLQGAKFESGLDNSPMYDGAAFDPRTHKMRLADVGLMSLYVADCDALAEIAGALGRAEEAGELRGRAGLFRSRLASLWSPERGMFLNRNLDTGEPSLRMSPTNFYPLLAKAATAEQARRMVAEHLMNPGEFWGRWVVPATPRNDPAFGDQAYWRGRIWGPMNFLIYLGLRNYDMAGARAELAGKSEELLLKEWVGRGHIHENYSALTGEGDDVKSSDPFYHWGALLGAIPMMEAEGPPRP